MFNRLPRGLVLKSETCQKGEAFYTIIIKNRFSIPWINKTASLYKNWEDDSSSLELSKITAYDFRDYSKYIDSEILKTPDDEETARLSDNIENLLPEKTRKRIFGKDKITLINKIKISPDGSFDPSYDFEKQRISKINSLSKDISEKLYKKALSIIQILPL